MKCKFYDRQPKIFIYSVIINHTPKKDIKREKKETNFFKKQIKWQIHRFLIKESVFLSFWLLISIVSSFFFLSGLFV
ncbi:hypothetical protein GQ457_07G009040 [Hibiscus cannabinus]